MLAALDAWSQPVTTDMRGFVIIIGFILLSLGLAVFAASAALQLQREAQELRDRVARLEGRADRHADTR